MLNNRKHQILVKTIVATLCTLSVATVLSVTPLRSLPTVAAQSSSYEQNQVNKLQSANWAPTVKKGLNDFLRTYGNSSATYTKINHSYAVFDFDNTTSIMDVEEQLIIWQLDHLAFAIAPEQFAAVLRSGIPADKLAATYGALDGKGNPVIINAAINDASKAYAALYQKKLVSTTGKELSAQVKASPDFKEFTAKMRWLYDAIGETMDASVSYPWVTYWFTGMTPKQVYKLAYACDKYYSNPVQGCSWSKGTYASPPQAITLAGPVSVSYKLGVTVTPEIRELYGSLQNNDIDNWICSASALDVIKAAVDAFKLPGVKGIVAMTNKTLNGKYINSYDYDLHAQTQGVGKAEAVGKILVPKYKGHGPAFCAMDSQGDFNFCTEFKDTKAVLIVNRQRKDDAALCAGIAVWQKEQVIDLATANKNADSLFLLQGRNENNGTFWPDDSTLLLGKKEKVFLSAKGKKALEQLNSGMSIAQVLKTDTKLEHYQGYKTR